MKRIFTFIVMIILVVALCGCGAVKGGTSGQDVVSNSTGSGSTDTSGNTETVYPTEIIVPTTATMVVGDTLTLNVSYTPADTTVKNVTWASDDESVASVDATSGSITAKKSGVVHITATSEGEEGTLADSCELTVKSSSSDESIVVADQTGDFAVTVKDDVGAYEITDNVYTITAAGEYTFSGLLNGQIVVDAGDEDKVTLVLDGATVRYDQNSPILIKNADSVTVKAAKGSQNTVYDMRILKTEDSEEQGEGAISAKCDLKLAATGTLYVEGNYNNGIHTTKDLEIQKITLKVKAVNNALKGKDSVTINSGTLVVISTAGDGIETTDSDVSSKGNQRGTVTINDGDVEVYAAGDGIQAAYNFEMNGGTLTVRNGSYSAYTAKNAAVDSYKGVKVKNELNVNGGQIYIHSYDDGLHADYGTELENGEIGQGVININDGTVNISVTSSSSRYVSGADAIHADNELNVSGGVVTVSSAYEGLEANVIAISGGTITVSATDDGLNAAKKVGKTPSITVSGGYLDVTMAGGDTDGIDSNGSFTMTGGIVVSRGAPGSGNGMATGLDCDGAATIGGGTFVQLGSRETVLSTSGCATLNFGSSSSGGFGGPGGGMRPGGFCGMSAGSSYTFSAGTWTLNGTDISFTVASGYSYGGCVIYSSSLTAGTTYTITNGTTSYSASVN